MTRKEVNNSIGKQVMCDTIGKVKILEYLTKGKVLVQDLEKGAGWNEAKRTYVGVRTKNGWFRGQNYTHLGELKVHMSTLMEMAILPNE